MNWIDLALDSHQWIALVELLSGCATGGLSRRAQLQGVIWYIIVFTIELDATRTRTCECIPLVSKKLLVMNVTQN
jgi:hypothetical protein